MAGFDGPAPALSLMTVPDVEVFRVSAVPDNNRSLSTVDKESTLLTFGDGRGGYSVMFGGAAGDVPNGGVGSGQVVTNSSASWMSESGYALVWGWRPVVETTRVVTGSDGTTLLVLIHTESSVETHFVLLIKGGPTEVTTKVTGTCTPKSEFLVQPWTYAKCVLRSGCADITVHSIADNPKLRRFARAVLRERRNGILVPQ
jgi:hypothetical protein